MIDDRQKRLREIEKHRSSRRQLDVFYALHSHMLTSYDYLIEIAGLGADRSGGVRLCLVEWR
jgi:hypothetical protein